MSGVIEKDEGNHQDVNLGLVKLKELMEQGEVVVSVAPLDFIDDEKMGKVPNLMSLRAMTTGQIANNLVRSGEYKSVRLLPAFDRNGDLSQELGTVVASPKLSNGS